MTAHHLKNGTSNNISYKRTFNEGKPNYSANTNFSALPAKFCRLAIMATILFSLSACTKKVDLSKSRAILPVTDEIAVDGKLESTFIAIEPITSNATWPYSEISMEGNYNYQYSGNYSVIDKFRLLPALGISRFLMATPVMNDKLIITIDSSLQVKAFDRTSHALLWAANLKPLLLSPKPSSAYLTLSSGHVYVATSTGFIVAINMSDGSVKWHRNYRMPFRSPARTRYGNIYTVSPSNTALMISGDSGDVQWRREGSNVTKATLPHPSVLIAQDKVLVPQTSGELASVDAFTGNTLWYIDILSGDDGSLFKMADIDSNPVLVAGDNVFVSSKSGAAKLINVPSGYTFWNKSFTVQSPVAISREFGFFIDTSNRLVSLFMPQGEVKWYTDLNEHLYSEKEITKKKRKFFNNLTPVMVNNELVVFGGRKKILVFNPQNGELLRTIKAPSALNNLTPAIINGLIYFTTPTGQVFVMG